MNLRSPIPNFFVRPRNMVIQIIFTTIFAYIFILIYHPFGSQGWFEVNQGQFAFYAGFVVVLGMIVVIVSRVIISRIGKRRSLSITGYAVMVALEVLAMTGFYMMIQKVFLNDTRFWFEVYYTAIFHTSLILLFPYLISLLYFAWQEKKRHVETLLGQIKTGDKPLFIPFSDENGELRLTIKSDDLLFIEASENYVFIHYLEGDKPGRFLLRSSMKRLEEELMARRIIRCHRSYMINLAKVKMIRKNKGNYLAIIDSPSKQEIPVTGTYRENVIHMAGLIE